MTLGKKRLEGEGVKKNNWICLEIFLVTGKD